MTLEAIISAPWWVAALVVIGVLSTLLAAGAVLYATEPHWPDDPERIANPERIRTERVL